MKSHHINLGRTFAQPYESDYAVLRRCLVANPGVTLETIRKDFKQFYPGSKNFIERIRSIQDLQESPKLANGPTTTFKRQCPVCAQSLYHTDIYALPWLTTCPIHHCVLTYTCPSCNRPWPDEKEITKRDCSTCGITSFKRIHSDVVSNMRSMEYKRIESINRFINDKNLKGADSGCSLVISLKDNHYFSSDNPWWQSIPVTNPLYPSFQVNHSKVITSYDLDQLSIYHKKVRSKSSLLMTSIQYGSKCDYYLDDDEMHLEWLGQAMRHIVSWIKNSTSESHKIRIVDYSCMFQRTHNQNRELCPYCAALSIWFYNYAHLYTRGRRKYLSREYDFMKNSGFSGFFSTGEPYVTVNDYDFYKLDFGFSKWFYQRGLMLSYVNILSHLMSLFENKSLAVEYNSSFHTHEFTDYEILNDQLCSFEIRDDKLVFYYENDDVLDTNKSPKLADINYICNIFHLHYSIGFRYDFPSTEFTENEFSKLITAYRQYH